ncbi:hypothetical protein [Burkholderia glumae]|uniref:hypothetical protein n=1 Tax=Burkholderia glumae TaxID=337 RepID=UPI001463BD0A|nr:hypothetical protein [Burkholderia glumae]QJP70854.1 hypothetical protein HJC54_11735 [Burkholderia glumae]
MSSKVLDRICFLQWKQCCLVSGVRGFESLDVPNDDPRQTRRRYRRPAMDHLPARWPVPWVMASQGCNEIPSSDDSRPAPRAPSGIRHVIDPVFKLRSAIRTILLEARPIHAACEPHPHQRLAPKQCRTANHIDMIASSENPSRRLSETARSFREIEFKYIVGFL